MEFNLLAESLGEAQSISYTGIAQKRVGLPILPGWVPRSLSCAWGSFGEHFCGLPW